MMDLRIADIVTVFNPIVTVTEFDDGSTHVNVDWLDSHEHSLALMCTDDLSYEKEVELDPNQGGLTAHVDGLVKRIKVTIEQEEG